MSKKTNNIVLVPTDFSEVCKNAADHAASVARFLGYDVLLLHVINNETESYLSKNNLSGSFIEKKLSEWASLLRTQHDIKTETLSVEGSIFNKIAEVAEIRGADLIVLGTHGKTGFQKLFGSFALKVILSSPVPVLVVQKRAFENGFKNIVFPISDFLEDRQKVRWAVYLAKTFKSCIHIYQDVKSDPAQSTRITIVTKHIKDEFEKSQVSYKIIQSPRKTKFADNILDYAVTIDADLIMIMTGPETPLPEYRFTPWVEKLIFNTSQIPVMCLNPLALSKFYYVF